MHKEEIHSSLSVKYGGSIKVDTIGGGCCEIRVTYANKTVVEKLRVRPQREWTFGIKMDHKSNRIEEGCGHLRSHWLPFTNTWMNIHTL